MLEYIIVCSVSVAIVLCNIINAERGDNSHSVAIRMHSERSVSEVEESIKIKPYKAKLI